MITTISEDDSLRSRRMREVARVEVDDEGSLGARQNNHIPPILNSKSTMFFSASGPEKVCALPRTMRLSIQKSIENHTISPKLAAVYLQKVSA
jgi:hypothetical protein